jgi:hypothetical protein
VSEQVWFRYGLGPDVVADVVFTEQPTYDDIASFLEILDVQIKVLRRAENRQAVARGSTGDDGGEGEEA